jgi:hypothetical protein
MLSLLVIVVIIGIIFYFLARNAACTLTEITLLLKTDPKKHEESLKDNSKYIQKKGQASALSNLSHIALFLLLFFLAIFLATFCQYIVGETESGHFYPDNHFPFILLAVLSLLFVNYLTIQRFHYSCQEGDYVSSMTFKATIFTGICLTVSALSIVTVYVFKVIGIFD